MKMRWIKRNFIPPDLGTYWLWAFLRLLLTIVPQSGYIHPDEFFQSVEVFGGNVFETETTIPWEFNATFPLRSIPVMYIVTTFPFTILNVMSNVFGPSALTTYWVLVTPRIFMCILSFLSDVYLYKICYLYGQNYKRRLLIYASSYVTLVYAVRTFSNTMEMLLFNSLLYLVASSMAETEKVNYQDDFLIDKYKEAATTADRVRIWKLRKLLPSHTLKNFFPIAAVTVAGVFNRPTFVTFAVLPVSYWLKRGLRQDEALLNFHSRLFLLIICSIPIACLFIFLDSAYYGYITWGEIINGDVSLNSFVVTPYNFIIYNIDNKNLAEHGIHPRWLHILVNLPLLFNFLAIAGMLVVINMVYRGSQAYWTQLPKPESITGMMSTSAFVPVILLSIFPHQEPRFIAPVLLPLVFLYSHIITQFEEDCPAPAKRPKKMKELPFIGDFDNRPNIQGRFIALNYEAITGKPSAISGIGRYELLRWWMCINLLFTVFYGFIHQGGVYDLTKDFREKLIEQPKYTTYHLLYSHIYPIPQHLLMQPTLSTGRVSNFFTKQLTSNLEKNLNRIAITIRASEELKKSRRRAYRVFYAIPSPLFLEFEAEYLKTQGTLAANFTYDINKIFFPHISLEAPLKIPDLLSIKDIKSCFELILLEIIKTDTFEGVLR